ncbi:MAG: deoxyribose-phosphate aldolase [Bacillota bacterium]
MVSEEIVEKLTEEIYKKVMSEIEEKNDVSSGSQTYQNKTTAVNGDIASLIDHTILSPDATVEDVKKVCAEAREYNFASVCVNPDYVSLVHDELNNSNVKICTVIGFPLGATTTKSKVCEAKEAIENGAQELDMVINVGALKSGKFDKVKRDIEEVVVAARGRALVKVIIEACLLTDGEKVKACSLAKVAGADFVKTSTGFSSGGATVEDIELMRETVGPDMGVKASGGIRDYKKAKAMIDAGATRIGASGSVDIVEGKIATDDYGGVSKNG